MGCGCKGRRWGRHGEVWDSAAGTLGKRGASAVGARDNLHWLIDIIKVKLQTRKSALQETSGDLRRPQENSV